MQNGLFCRQVPEERSFKRINQTNKQTNPVEMGRNAAAGVLQLECAANLPEEVDFSDFVLKVSSRFICSLISP